MSDSLENDTANIRKLWDRFSHIPPKIMVSNTTPRQIKTSSYLSATWIWKNKNQNIKAQNFRNNKSNIQTNFLYISCGKFPTQRKFIVVFVLVRVDRFFEFWSAGIWEWRLLLYEAFSEISGWNFEFYGSEIDFKIWLSVFFIKKIPDLIAV